MKIQSKDILLFIVNYFPPHVGGLERYVEGLAQALCKISEHEIHVITHRESSRDQRFEKTKEGIFIHRVDAVFTVADVLCIPHPLQILKLLLKFKAKRIQAISIHTRFFPISLIGALFGKWTSTKVVFTEHGSDYVRFPSSKQIEALSKLYDHTLGRLTIRLSTIRSGASQGAVRFIEKLGGAPVLLIENAVDLDFWSKEVTFYYQHFLYLGRIASGKGWEVAVQSHQAQDPLFREQYPLIIIGDGSEKNQLEAMISGDTQIRFLGSQDQKTIRNYLKNAITLNPTQLSEGLQTVLIEAAASGSWILSSPTQEAVRFLGQGFGKIVTSDWEKALRDSIHERPSSSSRELLGKYSWDLRARNFLSILEEKTTNTLNRAGN